MKETTKLSDVLKAERTDRKCWDIRGTFDKVFGQSAPIKHPYSIEVQNAAAGKREPMSRVEWENYWNAEKEFAR